MSGTLRLLSAGAAQGLANALAPRLLADGSVELKGAFMPVGAVRERLLAGEACDVVVSTPAMLEELARDQKVDGATIASLGRVHTAVAVRTGEPRPPIETPEALAGTLAAAERVFVPDLDRATAGIHFAKVLRALGLRDAVASRLSVHASGAEAMAALAASRQRPSLGCTQATEIRNTEGVQLVGPLPAPFALATFYAAAVSASAHDAHAARRFVALLSGPEAAALRHAAGFES
jgi:molybdate transport system substrate-binding protein